MGEGEKRNREGELEGKDLEVSEKGEIKREKVRKRNNTRKERGEKGRNKRKKVWKNTS
jgi:hypothetical protein